MGVGLLKPNISTMVGALYPKGDSRRDSGFTIFYIGINIGAVLAPFIVGYFGEKVNWYLGFSLAGFGMILGQIVYVFGGKYLKGIGELLKSSEETAHLATKPLTKEDKGPNGLNADFFSHCYGILGRIRTGRRPDEPLCPGQN
jgi:POT family proton-dependent oligopeptide transporter